MTPIAILAITQVLKFGEAARRRLYTLAGLLTLVGIFAMRWNVVIGGQLFSKSFLGYTTYRMGFATREGLLTAIVLSILPFGILWRWPNCCRRGWEKAPLRTMNLHALKSVEV
jgi:predicted membrane protein